MAESSATSSTSTVSAGELSLVSTAISGSSCACKAGRTAKQKKNNATTRIFINRSSLAGHGVLWVLDVGRPRFDMTDLVVDQPIQFEARRGFGHLFHRFDEITTDVFVFFCIRNELPQHGVDEIRIADLGRDDSDVAGGIQAVNRGHFSSRQFHQADRKPIDAL